MDIEDLCRVINESSDSEERIQAVENVVESDDYSHDVIKTLISCLKSDDAGIKDICFRYLAAAPEEFRSLIAEYAVLLTLQDEIELRNLAGDLLMKLGEFSVEPMLEYLYYDDFDVRKFICDILGVIGNEGILDRIYVLLDDEDINVVSSALEAMGNIRSATALPVLFDQYGKSEDLKPVIIEAVGKIGGIDAQSFLLEKMNNENDIFLQTACIDALALGGDDLSICDYLLKELPNAKEEIKVVLLKTIYAIAFRQEQIIELPQELRYVARMALYDDDSDIRAAGLIALGSVYEEGDYPALINEIITDNPETQQMILFNLLSNSDESSIASFFNYYYSVVQPNGTGIDFLSLITLFWEEIPPENAHSAINAILSLVLSVQKGDAAQIVEIFTKIDPALTIDCLDDYLFNGNMIQREEVLDIIDKLYLKELSPSLKRIAESTDNNAERAKEILSRLG